MYSPIYNQEKSRQFLASLRYTPKHLQQVYANELSKKHPQEIDRVIEDTLQYLSFRERESIKLQLQMYTLEEIGRGFFLSKQRMSQIKNKALQKLKNSKIVRKTLESLLA